MPAEFNINHDQLWFGIDRHSRSDRRPGCRDWTRNSVRYLGSSQQRPATVLGRTAKRPRGPGGNQRWVIEEGLGQL